jgi:uncharacterized protein YndB with AHSA1/START domain
MATRTETTVEREIAIAASPETVWQFLVDPEKATRWMGKRAELDPRAGGVYRVEVISGNVASGEFVEVDPPRRLVWTFGWDPSHELSPNDVGPGSSTIEVELIPDGEGTMLRFTHRDLPDAGAAGRHAHGWDHYLPRLQTAAAGGDPGRDTWLDAPPSMD